MLDNHLSDAAVLKLIGDGEPGSALTREVFKNFFFPLVKRKVFSLIGVWPTMGGKLPRGLALKGMTMAPERRERVQYPWGMQ